MISTAAVLSLDVRRLARAGGLELGRGTRLGWRDSTGVVWAAETEVVEDDVLAVELEAPVIRLWGVGLDVTPCTFGGERPWFLCPVCGRRVAVLFVVAGAFDLACRSCHGLRYASQYAPFEAAMARLGVKEAVLRDRLAPARIDGVREVGRPYGMHRTTHRRLLRELADLGAERMAALVRELGGELWPRGTALG